LTRNFSTVWVIGSAGFIIMANNWILSLIIPDISKEFSLTVSQASMVITVYMLSFGLSQMIFGPLGDRYGKFQVIVFSLGFLIFTGILCSLAMDFTTLVLFRILNGVFAASVMPLSNALIGDIFQGEERQKALGLFQGLSRLGQGLSMILGGVIAIALGWRGVFAVISLLAFIPFSLLVKRYRNIRVQKNKVVFNHYILLFKNYLHLKTYLVIFIEGALIGGVYSYLGAFIEVTYHLGVFPTGCILALYGITTFLFGTTSGKLAEKWGQKTELLIGLGTGTIMSFVLFFWGNVLIALIVAIIFLGLTSIYAHLTLLAIVAEFSQDVRGLAMSMSACSFMAGSGTGTAVGGCLLEKAGYQALFLVYGFIFMFLLIIVEKRLQLPYRDAELKVGQ